VNERQEAGQRLKRAIHIARAQAEIDSDMQLSLRAGVHYDTLMNWYGGRTTPRPFELRKVAKVLGTPYAELWSAYEDIAVEPVPLTEAVRELVPELRELIAELKRRRAS
jgi:lambda repressor-like predicted transcriptional regulator